MADADRLWDHVCAGGYLWPWRRATLQRTADPQRMARLVRAMLEPGGVRRRLRIALGLRWLTGAAGDLDDPTLRVLIGATAPCFDYTAMAELIGNDVSAAVAQTAMLLLANAGDRHLRLLREVVSGPPLPVVALEGWASAGGKLAALELLAPHLSPNDGAMLLAVAVDPHEPHEVRFAAIRPLLALTAAEHAAAVAEALLRAPLPRPMWPLGEAPAEARQAMAPPLAEGLRAADHTTRHRALVLLAALGDLAVESLADAVRSGDDHAVRQVAQEVLARLDRDALRAARAERRTDGRALSPAAPPSTDPTRGLSPSEEPNHRAANDA